MPKKMQFFSLFLPTKIKKYIYKYEQQVVEEKDIPGGAGQGVPAGLWIFLLLIDSTGPKANIEPIGQIITHHINS